MPACYLSVSHICSATEPVQARLVRLEEGRFWHRHLHHNTIFCRCHSRVTEYPAKAGCGWVVARADIIGSNAATAAATAIFSMAQQLHIACWHGTEEFACKAASISFGTPSTRCDKHLVVGEVDHFDYLGHVHRPVEVVHTPEERDSHRKHDNS